MAVRPITDTLRDLRGGLALDEASEKLNALVAAVTKTTKAGRLTITLTVKPYSANDASVLTIEDDIKVALPEGNKGGTLMFATPENNLSRRDPRQPDLPGIVEVKKEAASG